MDRLDTIEIENSKNLKSFTMTLGSYYTIGLYLLFSAVDFIFYHKFAVEFFLIRIGVVISVILSNKLILKTPNEKFSLIQKICSIPFIVCAFSINYMVFRISDGFSPYWAGLAIVVAGLSIGFRFSWKYYLSNLAIITIPLIFFASSIYIKEKNNLHLLSPIFLLSISVVCVSGRWFYEKLSFAEYSIRMKLVNEIESRNRIIEEKTLESVRLNSLGKQFSPQVIQSIKSGEITLASKVHRAEICAIFVDIKDSTYKFSMIDRDDLQKIIAMYMEDVMGVFLKYDITIDKFLGDGVMGFSNDPKPQADYLERALLASFEIKNKILLKQDWYSRYWGSEFQIRIGLSSGLASVGFYGSDMHVKSYTAIGRVVNLASRVNSVAPPNGIAISNEIILKLKNSNSNFLREMNIADIEEQKLKGFEQEKIKLMTVDKFQNVSSLDEDESCPHGHGPLMISQNQNGIYVFKCRYCDFAPDSGIASLAAPSTRAS